MDIETLASAVYEDLEARIIGARIAEEGLVLDVACDDRDENTPRRHFELFCSAAEEWCVSVGDAGAIEFTEEHPVLLEHKGAQGSLYFSSAPARPDEVFYRAHATLYAEFSGWRAPSRFLNGTPTVFRRFLEGGSGLLARGPVTVLEKLKSNLQPLLDLNVVYSYQGKPHWKALIVGTNWVVCASVRVRERVG
jgi:hypothetical protein